MTKPKIIAITNHKGGTGKTTVTANLAAALTRSGRQVHIIDLDPQGGLTRAVGGVPIDDRATVADVLCGDLFIESVIVETSDPRITLTPASLRLAVVKTQLHSKMQREFLLYNAIERWQQRSEYGYILIDCPPDLDLLTVNALAASTHVLVVSKPEFADASAALDFLSTFDGVRKFRPNLQLLGVLLNQWRNESHYQNVVDSLSAESVPLLATRIRRRAIVNDATAAGQSVFAHRSGNRRFAAIRDDFAALAQEIIEKC